MTKLISLNGYHGTTENTASVIKKENRFLSSVKDNEWLGNGVYFFAKKEHAAWWAREQGRLKDEPAAVLSVMIQCEKFEYLDLDVLTNMIKVKKTITETYKIGYYPSFKNVDELRCFCVNFYIELHPEYKVMSYTFPHDIKFNEIGFPCVVERRQHCVSDNSCINIVNLEVV